MEVEEAGDSDDEMVLYRLIRQRTLASQLEDAVYAVRTAQLKGEHVDAKAAIFEAKGRTILSPGWKQLMESDQSEDDQGAAASDSSNNPVPQLKPGARLAAASGRLLSKKTSPPRTLF